MKKIHKIIYSIILFVLLILLVIVNSIPGPRFIDTFHTGAPAWDYLYQESNYQNNNYLRWNTAKPYIKYALIQSAVNLMDNGDTIPTMYLDGSWSGITRQLNIIFENGNFPVLELWLTNFENVSETGLTLFLAKLSNWIRPHEIIFNPCFEYNFPNGIEGWGDRGNGQTYKISAAVYNQKMVMIRNILDRNNIKNIYLGSHGNLLRGYNSDMEGLVEYFAGMRQADVIGFSHYDNNITASWAWAKQVYQAINVSKPFIFFEYSPNNVWSTKQNVTRQFVIASYRRVLSYPFVKGLIWYFGQYFSEEAMGEIAYYARTYDSVLA